MRPLYLVRTYYFTAFECDKVPWPAQEDVEPVVVDEPHVAVAQLEPIVGVECVFCVFVVEQVAHQQVSPVTPHL